MLNTDGGDSGLSLGLTGKFSSVTPGTNASEFGEETACRTASYARREYVHARKRSGAAKRITPAM